MSFTFFIGYGAGYGAMSAAGTSQYGVAASTTALAGQNAAVAAAAGNPAAQGAATTGDYASFNQVYGRHPFISTG